MMSAMGIRTRFSIFILGTVAAVLISSMAITLTTVRRFTLEDVEDFSTTILQETNTKITTFITEMEYLARSLAEYPVVRALDTPQFRDLFLSQVLVRSGYLRAIYVGTEDGAMHEYGEGPGFVDHVPNLPEDYDPRRRPWYHAALAAGDFVVSDPYLYASYPVLGITGAVPVYGLEPPYALMGVLGVDILLDDLRTVLWELQVPKDGKVLLIDEEGRIIASQFDGKDRYATTLPEFDPELFARIQEEGASSFSAEYQGRRMKMSHTVNPATGWFLVLALPYTTVMEPANRVLRLMLMMDVLLLTLLLTTIRLLSGRLVLRPLEQMVSTVNCFHLGDRSARVEGDGEDEFGMLAREFNSLVATVQAHTEQMEAQVAARTAEARALEQENSRLRLVEERERIFRDLHDSLGAQLTNISICTTVAEASQHNHERLQEMLHRIDTNTRAAMEHLRETVLGEPDFSSLQAVLERLEQMIHRRLSINRTNVHISTSLDRPALAADPPHREVLETLYRVAEESVSNIQRHAHADRVDVAITAAGGTLQFECRDNGCGFDQEAVQRGMGLSNMEYRAHSCGGTLEVESGTTGTVTRLTLPVGREVVP